MFGINVAGNSQLSKEELLNAARGYGMNVNQEKVSDLFFCVDRSGKGFINMRDFIPIAISNNEIGKEAAIREAFAQSLPTDNICKIKNFIRLITPYALDRIEEEAWIKALGQDGMKIDYTQPLSYYKFRDIFKLLFKTEGLVI